jgi:hypothetical protein
MKQEKLFLICDCWGGTQMQLVESKSVRRDGRIVFYGPFTEVNRENRNGRIYPDPVMRPEFNRLSTLATEGKLTGEADHPTDSIIHIQSVSHRISRLWWDEHRPTVGWCECVTLNTPNGRVVEALLMDGVPVGISSRGVGSGSMNESGKLVISEGFRLVTGDIVGDPSYQEAWMSIKESVENDIKTGRKRFSLNGIEIPKMPIPVVKMTIEEAVASGMIGSSTSAPVPGKGPQASASVSLEEALMFVASKAAKKIKSSIK